MKTLIITDFTTILPCKVSPDDKIFQYAKEAAEGKSKAQFTTNRSKSFNKLYLKGMRNEKREL